MIIQSDFLTAPPLVQYQIENRPMSQPEALLYQHGTAALVGSMTFFDFGTNGWGGGQLKKHPV